MNMNNITVKNLSSLQAARRKGTVATLCMVCVMFFAAAGCGMFESEGEMLKPLFPNTDANALFSVEHRELIDFFEEHLPVWSGERKSMCIFFGAREPYKNPDGTMDYIVYPEKEDKCIVINNIEEFIEIISCDNIELPEIDFNSYTLIVGMHITTRYGVYCYWTQYYCRLKTEFETIHTRT